MSSPSIKTCIREAMEQLIEYSYYPNKYLAKKLIIVSYNNIDNVTISYLKHIREKLHLPIYYRKYDTEKKILEEIEY